MFAGQQNPEGHVGADDHSVLDRAMALSRITL
jgi:hypothetical protein